MKELEITFDLKSFQEYLIKCIKKEYKVWLIKDKIRILL